MTDSEFRQLCQRLNKSRAQVAVLLGVAEKTILAYETGSRAIPWQIERKLFFYISGLRSEELSRKPCWVILNCPQTKRMSCPAYEFESGTVCWLINGTLCNNNPCETWRQKWATCRECIVISSLSTPRIDQVQSHGKSEDPTDEISQLELIVGKDPKMQSVFKLIIDIAKTNTTVMIQGESGTGKELVARAIHSLSLRRDKPFIVINCSAFPETLLESELFGYEKGAFTGANKTRAGRFEQADGGTVFLDEIGEISPQAQVSLLRVLQTKKLQRLGGDQVISVDIRVITATNKNLRDQMREKKFRDDLYYRLHVVPIDLPALREKRNDIPLLAKHFLKRFALEFAKEVHEFSPEAMQKLSNYRWPGNTRQLEHVIEFAVALAKGAKIEVTDLPISINEELDSDVKLSEESLISNEKKHILQVLQACNWNKKTAALRLRISRSALYDKLKRYDIA